MDRSFDKRCRDLRSIDLAANQCERAALPKLIGEAGSAHIPIAYQ